MLTAASRAETAAACVSRHATTEAADWDQARGPGSIMAAAGSSFPLEFSKGIWNDEFQVDVVGMRFDTVLLRFYDTVGKRYNKRKALNHKSTISERDEQPISSGGIGKPACPMVQ